MASGDEKSLRQHIHDLVDEEHRLRSRHGGGEGLSDAERARLDHVEQELDQTWDLLRRRMARSDAGESPNDEQERDVKTVEGYLQ